MQQDIERIHDLEVMLHRQQITKLDYTSILDIKNVRHRLQKIYARIMIVSYMHKAFPNSEVCYTHGNLGEPLIFGPGNMQVSVSHSNNIVAVAFSQVDIGLDIEEPTRLLPGVFSNYTKYEKNDVLNSNDIVYEFMRLWTCKEALLKKEKVGLKHGLQNSEIKILDTRTAINYRGTIKTIIYSQKIENYCLSLALDYDFASQDIIISKYI